MLLSVAEVFLTVRAHIECKIYLIKCRKQVDIVNLRDCLAAFSHYTKQSPSPEKRGLNSWVHANSGWAPDRDGTSSCPSEKWYTLVQGHREIGVKGLDMAESGQLRAVNERHIDQPISDGAGQAEHRAGCTSSSGLSETA